MQKCRVSAPLTDRLAVDDMGGYGGIIGYNYIIISQQHKAVLYIFIIISYIIGIATPLNPLILLRSRVKKFQHY